MLQVRVPRAVDRAVQHPRPTVERVAQRGREPRHRVHHGAERVGVAAPDAGGRLLLEKGAGVPQVQGNLEAHLV